ncbi:MAG: T9SS type A sorting domain-containing protein, partial [Elusimicrobia bacterium]|nr:T9SS type A sorting domain-containing protein [Elusimicrobiota bacterium]
VKAGDTIYLRNGYHGSVFIRGGYNNDYITIEAQEGHTPILKKIQLSAVAKWIVRGLTITPEHAPEYEKSYLIFIESHGWHGPSEDVIIEHNTVCSVQDTAVWTADDWNNFACAGIKTHASFSIIRNNRLINVNFGIVVSGDNSIVEYNTIINLCGDGIVGSADNLTLQYNVIKNFYKVNENHDDGIQFHRGTNPDNIPMKNALLRGNVIISKEPGVTNPLVGSPQGIGCFDSEMYIGWRVENNLVLVQHYHGISVYGAKDSIIVNNLAYDVTGEYPAWITTAGKGDNTIVRNNMSKSIESNNENLIIDHNINLKNENPEDYFMDYQAFDFRLKKESPATDQGSNEQAPSIDLVGTVRGELIDVGPYEFGAKTLFPEYPENNAIVREDDIKTKKAFEGRTVSVYNNIIKPQEHKPAGFIITMPESGQLCIRIYNSQGKCIKTIVHAHKIAGITYRYEWDGNDDAGNVVGSGIYIVHVKAGNFTETKKIAVVK